MRILVAYFEDLAGMAGGLERVLCNVSNEMFRRGHSVEIVTYDNSQGRPFYTLDERIPLINMQKSEHKKLGVLDKVSRETYRLFGKKAVRHWKEKTRNRDIPRDFRRIAEEFKPDVVLAFNHETSGEIYKSAVKPPVVSMFHNDPRILCEQMLDFEKEGIEASAAIQILIPSYESVIRENFKNHHIVYIPNVVPQREDLVDLSEDKQIYRIVEVARLNKKQKRQQIIVEAFARLAEKYPQWIVELWGGDTSGAEKYLRSLIGKYHLEDRILLKGLTKDVDAVYESADIFAFPSAFEGFPLAMTEAMTAGLPVVGCRSCTSVAMLVRDGENGLLAEDNPADFAGKLEELMRNRELRVEMGKNAHEAMRIYEPSRIWDQWENLLMKVSAEAKVD